MTTKPGGITAPTIPATFTAGTFILSNTITTTVAAPAITAASVVSLTPLNAAAATLMGSVKSLYLSARTAGTSFAVSTANGVAAVGTEQFQYSIMG